MFRGGFRGCEKVVVVVVVVVVLQPPLAKKLPTCVAHTATVHLVPP